MFGWFKRLWSKPNEVTTGYKPHVLFVILGPGSDWISVEASEQRARWFVQGYRSVSKARLSVSRVVDGREQSRVSVPVDFDPTVPLFPLEASAS